MRAELDALNTARTFYLMALNSFGIAENLHGACSAQAQEVQETHVNPAQADMHQAEATLAECWPATPMDLARMCQALLSPEFGATEETQARLHRYAQAFVRLADFATTAGVTPPSAIVDDDGGPSTELLAFTRENHLSLDAIFRTQT